MKSLTLSSPQTEQLSQLVELDRLCLGGLWTKEGYQRELKSPNSSFWVLSADGGRSLLGCGCFWQIVEEAHITLLMIHPDYQGQGLGQLLLYGLLNNAVQRQLERATLEVRVSNQIALSLYEKFGFQVAGRRKGYYQKTGEDALILWRGDLHRPQFQQDLSRWWPLISDRLTQNHWQLHWVKG
ncbi:ribosomal-protein-alanine acetyltransferase [Rippkaea orientalis PCC 8801]|uniref:Ribosomal-protein-alanine acetyltransferase n=1 Tax=Rippkaea orientalis (strain PCC 8801 / RF-1) TaxID=41431 RepID=B7K4L0_RIPO1|nr:ribosomal protein S18-alanine N-acetyltransferase [Rippkaea orientalis]ACK65475.1 ribosomal-protein-alanine acetyltransferase [Rippkaea orientalis PCC 8801]